MTALFTRADYDQLPEGFPAQLIDGMLVREPAPGYHHQRFASRIHQRLVELVGPDRALMSPVDVAIDEHNVFQPDLVVLSTFPDDEDHYVGVPLLAVEVLSLSTQFRDRNVKCRRLLEIGVEEVWLIDRKAQTIEVWDTDGSRIARADSEAVSSALPGFSLTPSALSTPPA